MKRKATKAAKPITLKAKMRTKARMHMADDKPTPPPEPPKAAPVVSPKAPSVEPKPAPKVTVAKPVAAKPTSGYIVLQWTVAKNGGASQDYSKTMPTPEGWDRQREFTLKDDTIRFGEVLGDHFEHVGEDEHGCWIYRRQ